jgi:ubiquinol-cytochrome c reductase cytochrome b subunit
MKPVLDWLEERTGIGTLVHHALYEDVPQSSGWKHVLGSVALFSFLIQVVTGILLAFNYAPTPGEAYNSLKFILTELTGGSVMRGLHHWGASVMIVVVVFHMGQVFLWGGYKKPREATWIVGVVLLLLTLAYGLTGYLLPWDNRAYWGTMVTVQIAGSAPVFGNYVQRLMGAEGGVLGVTTFSRFFAVHVLVLPPITMLMIAAHLYLVRRHGVAPQPDETLTTKFYPAQVYRDTVAVFVAFMILFTLAIVAKVPLGHVANPTDTSFIPRPEWYFLFLFQSLKFFEGPLELFGSLVLPPLAILVLFLIPFIDRSKAVAIGKRTTAMAALALAALTWGGLTAAAIKSTPSENEFVKALDAPSESWQEMPADQLAAVAYYRSAQCTKCHQLKDTSKPTDWLVDHFKQSAPQTQLKDNQWKALAVFQTKLTEPMRDALETAPEYAASGAAVYQANNCFVCHQVNGVGMKTGPPLSRVAMHREKQWVVDHFNDPQKMSPGTVMPPYKFSSQDLENITHYVMMLP